MQQCDSIDFNVDGSVRKIELCVGDITKLSMEDKVDILLVSAFPNDYTSIPGTLIGALKEIGISVRQLAKEKAEDLRGSFHCWISKELPATCPYKRILCYEENMQSFFLRVNSESHYALVGQVFRALFTTFHDDEWSLITPILASGCQHADPKKMLTAMVKSCSSWIKAGMPLSSMKIVIYKKNLEKPIAPSEREILDEFAKLKSELMWSQVTEKPVQIKYDYSFFFTNENEDSVSLFLSHFKKIYSKSWDFVRTTRIQDIESTESSKNLNISEEFQGVMLQSQKVVLFLCEEFLQQSKAVELYNLALCLSRRLHKNILVPIYLKTVANLPEYMSLNQWLDCRLKRIGDDIATIFEDGAKRLMSLLLVTDEKSTKPAQQSVYDIFISYCHKDVFVAKLVLNYLTSTFPDRKIFFDKNEIKTGYSWQETVYNSLNNSLIILALLSEDYLASSMCKEEFTIAVSQNQSDEFQSVLLPLWISKRQIQDVVKDTQISAYFTINTIFVPNVTVDSTQPISNHIKFLSFINEISDLYVLPILQQKKMEFQSSLMPLVKLEDAAMKARKTFFNANCREMNVAKLCDIRRLPSNSESKVKNSNDIVIVFHDDDKIYAEYLKVLIWTINKNISIVYSVVSSNENDMKHVQVLESSRIIITLLNPYFVSTESCLARLQVAISLHRRNKNILFCPIVLEPLPKNPSYLHLLPIMFHADDEMYGKIILDSKELIPMISSFQSHVSKQIRSAKGKISLKVHVMFLYSASWLAQIVSSNIEKSKVAVLYSTYDLFHTAFETPGIANEKLLDDKVTFIDIPQDAIDKIQIYLENHGSIDELVQKYDDVNNSGSVSSAKEKVIKSKSCLIM